MRIQWKRFLCTTDLSDLSNQAIPYAVALAKELKAKLYLCHVVDLPTAAMYGEAVVYSVDQQERNMEYAQEHLRRLVPDGVIDWEPLVTIGHTAHEITRLAQEKEIDLAISASHGRSGLKRLILGSVTERLMQTLPCPLMVVRGDANLSLEQPPREPKFGEILVGYDFSPDSDLAFQYGLSLAQEFQSELHLVHVIEPPLYKDLLDSTSYGGEAYRKDLREHLKEKLHLMIPEDARNWCEPKIVLLAGQPDEELTKYTVVQKMDMIVLGVRGQKMMERLFVGSTTDRVARKSPCPVLSVQPTVRLNQKTA